MTSSLVILAAIALVPLLAILLLRANGAVAFMSLCLGSVLVTYTATDVESVTSSLLDKGALATNQWVQLGLLVIPLLLAVLFTRGSVKSGKAVINILPAAATGLLAALLVVPLLSASLQRQVQSSSFWTQLSNAQTAVILGGAVFSLVFLLFTHRKKKSGDEEGKKKKKKD